MKVMRSLGNLVVGSVLLAPMSVFAQSAPVAVPIVGSPAAQRPPQPSAPPSQPTLPPSSTSAPTSASTMPGPLPKRGVRTLELSMKNGTVALNAQNVTLREIFAEWQRQTGCQFVNAEKLPATPVALQLPAGTPELAALDSIMRGLASSTTGYGYIVAPGARAAGPSATASSCGAVYILPSSRPTMMAGFAVPPPVSPVISPASPDDEIPPVVPAGRPVPGQFVPNQQFQAQPQPYQLIPAPAGPPQNQPQPTGGSTTPPQSPGFGPVAPTAPGAGGLNAPPPQPQQQPQQQPPNNGR